MVQTSVIFLLVVSYTLTILYFCLQFVVVCENLSLHVNNVVARLWDLKFNSLKSQVATFGSKYPTNPIITLLNALLQWADKVKYLGMYIVCNTALTDISSHVRQFYSRFNNVLSVIGKGMEMYTLHGALVGLCGRVPDLQSGGCGFESQAGLLRTKVDYPAFHPSEVDK